LKKKINYNYNAQLSTTKKIMFADIDLSTHDATDYVPTSTLYSFLNTRQRLKYFLFDKPFDKKGYLYYLATENFTKPWMNPHRKGIVRVNSATLNSGSQYNQYSEMVCHDTPGIFYTSETNQDGLIWISISLVKCAPIRPTHYALRGGASGGAFALRNWDFEASHDGVHWTALKKHINDTTLENDGLPGAWAIDGCNHFYQHFRLVSTGPQQHPSHKMIGAGGFEIYGYVKA
jgi:hypothetical protein